jgi:hypothetical protein
VANAGVYTFDDIEVYLPEVRLKRVESCDTVVPKVSEIKR